MIDSTWRAPLSIERQSSFEGKVGTCLVEDCGDESRAT
jgi:hypothetical protein